MAVRRIRHEPPSTQTTPILANKIGPHSAFIDKDEMIRLPTESLHGPGGATCLDVRPLLLRSMDHFFLKVICNRFSARQTVPSATYTPNASRNSFNVASGRSCTNCSKRGIT